MEVAVQAVDGQTVKGAEVSLIAKAAGTYNGKDYAAGEVVTTFKDGATTASAVPAGDYILRETKTPNGYHGMQGIRS